MDLTRMLAGHQTPPWLVALLRGVLEAVVIAALGAVAYWLNGDRLPAAVIPYVPFLLLLVRQLEGFVDQRIDPSRRRVDEITTANDDYTRPPVG